LGIVVFAFLGWLLYGRVVEGKFDLKIKDLTRVDISNGVAPELLQKRESRNIWYRGGIWLVNFL
jgi:hypothetical protein